MTGMPVISALGYGLFLIQMAIVVAILVLAIAALVTASLTRDDAFTVIDREKSN